VLFVKKRSANIVLAGKNQIFTGKKGDHEPNSNGLTCDIQNREVAHEQLLKPISLPLQNGNKTEDL
jgi:hypothetical protein